jgi:protein O-GlcNAc transferase
MGLVLHKSRELNAAIKSYQKVVSIKPDFFEAYNNMGNVFEDNDDLDLAIEAYKKALNI